LREREREGEYESKREVQREFVNSLCLEHEFAMPYIGLKE